MEQKSNRKGIGMVTFMYLLLSVVYIVIGLCEIIFPDFKDQYIVIIAGFILLIIGILMIVQYFISSSFKDLGKFGFSVGVLCVLAGAIVLIRFQAITGVLGTFLGICILFTAVIKLQNAVDMKSMDHAGWFVFLIIAVVFLISSILIILNPSEFFAKHLNIVYYIMVADGVVNLFSTIYLAFVIKAVNKRTTSLTIERERVPFARRETAAERISEDEVEVIIPNSGTDQQEQTGEQPTSGPIGETPTGEVPQEEKPSIWKRTFKGIQDKNS